MKSDRGNAAQRNFKKKANNLAARKDRRKYVSPTQYCNMILQQGLKLINLSLKSTQNAKRFLQSDGLRCLIYVLSNQMNSISIKKEFDSHYSYYEDMICNYSDLLNTYLALRTVQILFSQLKAYFSYMDQKTCIDICLCLTRCTKIVVNYFYFFCTSRDYQAQQRAQLQSPGGLRESSDNDQMEFYEGFDVDSEQEEQDIYEKLFLAPENESVAFSIGGANKN